MITKPRLRDLIRPVLQQKAPNRRELDENAFIFARCALPNFARQKMNYFLRMTTDDECVRIPVINLPTEWQGPGRAMPEVGDISMAAGGPGPGMFPHETVLK